MTSGCSILPSRLQLRKYLTNFASSAHNSEQYKRICLVSLTAPSQFKQMNGVGISRANRFLGDGLTCRLNIALTPLNQRQNLSCSAGDDFIAQVRQRRPFGIHFDQVSSVASRDLQN